MTPDELTQEIFNYCRQHMDSNQSYKVEEILFKFFSQNVCITKGENRHNQADVLHKWLEDISLILEAKLPNDKFYREYLFGTITQYRIKPTEPVYEYLYYCPEGDIKWMTEQESERDVYFIKAKETKRVRQ